jgi:hypothetical protein
MTVPPREQTGGERHIAAVHVNDKFLLTIKVYYSPTDAQVIVLKTILKFTLN